jgi:hypothetical protein
MLSGYTLKLNKTKEKILDLNDIGFKFNFFRTLIGVVSILHIFSYISDIDFFYGKHSIFPLEVSDILYSPSFSINIYKLSKFANLDLIIYSVFSLYIFLLVVLIAGYKTRIISFCLLIVHSLITNSNPLIIYGVDFFTKMSFFYLMVFPTNNINERIAKFYINIFRAHLSIAYFFSGLGKIVGYNWWNGESVWKAIHLPYSNLDFNIDFNFLSNYPVFFLLIGWIIIILELLYPLIFIKKIRKIWLYYILTMHIGIALILNLYFFSAIMIIWNLTAFYKFEKNESSNI